MKPLLYILVIWILFSSCKNSTKSKELEFFDKNQEKLIYSLINDCIIDSLYKPDLISIEAMRLCSTLSNDEEPPRPPGYFYCYDESLFDTLLKAKIIDTVDINYFNRQLQQKKQLRWDSSLLKKSTVNSYSLFEKRREDWDFDIYDYLKEKYNARSFISISTPLFSSNHKLIIVDVCQFCGNLCGSGVVYVFKQINGKWHVLYYNSEWIS